ncbi:M23 family metallopeptidase [Caulobacter sp. 1776]|uniref:M23 family metallopeptidase n=1 Tax=Caulobacter sp. 1776 TaxID=3156420 RepID=UPI00339515F9
MLARYGDKDLEAIIARPGLGKLADRRAIAGGTGAVLFLDVAAPATAPTPRALVHRLIFAPVTPADNAHWTPWNAEVLAAADGTVVEAVDGIPENNPVADDKAVPITVDNATGDHLVLNIGGGRFVTYAHLRPGSLKVRVGQRVRRGQVLANGTGWRPTEPAQERRSETPVRNAVVAFPER